MSKFEEVCLLLNHQNKYSKASLSIMNTHFEGIERRVDEFELSAFKRRLDKRRKMIKTYKQSFFTAYTDAKLKRVSMKFEGTGRTKSNETSEESNPERSVNKKSLNHKEKDGGSGTDMYSISFIDIKSVSADTKEFFDLYQNKANRNIEVGNHDALSVSSQKEFKLLNKSSSQGGCEFKHKQKRSIQLSHLCHYEVSFEGDEGI